MKSQLKEMSQTPSAQMWYVIVKILNFIVWSKQLLQLEDTWKKRNNKSDHKSHILKW